MRSIMKGDVTGDTYKVTAGDTAESIADAKKKKGNTKCIGAFISVEDNNVRIAFGDTDPTQAGLGHKVVAGDSIRLSGYNEVNRLSYINAVNGSDAVLQITIIF